MLNKLVRLPVREEVDIREVRKKEQRDKKQKEREKERGWAEGRELRKDGGGRKDSLPPWVGLTAAMWV